MGYAICLRNVVKPDRAQIDRLQIDRTQIDRAQITDFR